MSDGDPAPSAPRRKRKKNVARRLIRALHRDVGYLLVGLTIVYALSGLAVNHVEDWDPNFQNYEEQISLELPDSDVAETTRLVLEARGRSADDLVESYEAAPGELDLVFEHETMHVDAANDRVVIEGQQPRFLLRAANWLHLNRGKKAWTYFADGFAVLLLFLAISGLFMLPIRKGLLGRGGVLVIVGIAIPILYVTLAS